MSRPVIALRARAGDARCPVCRDDVAASPRLAPARCDGCAVAYHHACAVLIGRCATLGCAGTLAPEVEAPRRRAGACAPSTSGAGWGLADLVPDLIADGLVGGLVEGLVTLAAAAAEIGDA